MANPTAGPVPGELDEADYVVIGSGAGGGPVAANLALAGYKVILLEAGGDESPPEYQVPGFYTRSTEHPDLSWEYFVRHYADDKAQRRDTKHVVRDGRPAIFYPRAGTLGGCTAHHAMITVYPHAADWDRIAQLTGDARWKAEAMEPYFTRLEQCRFVKHRGKQGTPPSRHGYEGWLPTAMADLRFVLRDCMILRIALSGVRAEGGVWKLIRGLWRGWRTYGGNPWQFLLRYLDPNDEPLAADRDEGLYYVPVSVDGVRRSGARERVLETAAACPGRLIVVTHALATRILFEGTRAVGVDYLSGRHLYEADPRAGTRAADLGEARTVRARREVIVAAGAFNTPQLLMLSGIGPREQLEARGIEMRADRPGVGANLQDRREVALIFETKRDFSLTRGAQFRAPLPGEKPDPLYAKWLKGKGPYGTNGGIVALVRKSKAARFGPDVIAISVPGLFRGYFPGYSGTIERERNFYSWVILKAHTRGTSGTIRLASPDPRARPEIDFNYFETADEDADLDAVAEAIAELRVVARATRSIVRREVVPGADHADHQALRAWVRDESWGHHASCSARIGPADDPMAVVDSEFRVHGFEGLRVVDASVFPWIPGFFIVTAVYMIAEMASDLILADARAGAPPAGDLEALPQAGAN